MKRERITTLVLGGFALIFLYNALKRWSAFFAAQGTDAAGQMMQAPDKGDMMWSLVLFGIVIAFSVRNAVGSFSLFNKVFWFGFMAWGIVALLFTFVGSSMTLGTYVAAKALVNTLTGIGLGVLTVWQVRDGHILW